MKAIILAAGEGKRMRPLTLETPKPMIEVLGKPLLHRLIEALPPEITEVIIVIGYKGEQIRSYFGDTWGGRQIVYVQQEKPMGTGHALALCQKLISSGERFMFMVGDDIHSPVALARLLKHRYAVLVRPHPDPRRFGVIEVDTEGRVVGFEEAPAEPKSNLISLAVFVLDSSIFTYPQVVSRTGEYWSTDQIRLMMRDCVFQTETADFWMPMGTPADILAAENALRDRESASAVTSMPPVIILAGGKGTRLPAEEQDKPKCLVEIAGKPILAWQIEGLRKQGFSDIRLALGYKAEDVIAWLHSSGNNDVKYVVESEPLGTGGAIKHAAGGITTPFIALNVDDLADINYGLLMRHGMNGKYSVIAGMQFEDARTFGTLVCDEHKRICEFKEKAPEAMPGVVSIGHYYLQPEIFEGTPAKFSIEYDLFPRIAAQKKLVVCQHAGTYWLPTNTAEQLKAAREYFV